MSCNSATAVETNSRQFLQLFVVSLLWSVYRLFTPWSVELPGSSKRGVINTFVHRLQRLQRHIRSKIVHFTLNM